MISTLYKNAHVLTQTTDGDAFDPAEQAIAVSSDASGLIVINQSGSEILLNRASLKEFVKIIVRVKDLAEGDL